MAKEKFTPDQTCLDCGQWKNCFRPKSPSYGWYEDPEVIFILPYPEREDEDGKPYQGQRAQLLIDALDGYEGKYLITNLIKCITYEKGRGGAISLLGKKVAPPDKKHVEQCLNHLYEELLPYNGKVVMTFGAVAYNYFSGDNSKITTVAGSIKKVNFRDLEFLLIPNYDPGHVIRGHAHKDFKLFIEKAFRVKDGFDDVNRDNLKILNPKDGIGKINECIDLYRNGTIDHVLFDIENSISTEITDGGKIIMVSITHHNTNEAWAIPLYVTNTIHHQDWPYEVPTVDFEISEKERTLLKVAIGKLLEEVPISGHNLKYDIKWCGFENIVDFSKVKIFLDTLNVSVQMQGVGGGIDNSLKSLSRKYFNIFEDWDYVIEEYLSRFKLIKDRHFGMIPTGTLGLYACLDVHYNKLLEKHFLNTVEPSLIEASMMVTRATLPMVEPEIKGIQISKPIHSFLRESYSKSLIKTRSTIYELPTVKKFAAKPFNELYAANKNKKKPLSIEELKVKAFNLNNPAKVADVAHNPKFFGLPVVDDYKTEKGMPSLNKEARAYFLRDFLRDEILDAIKAENETQYETLVEAKTYLTNLDRYKRISKLKNDYIESFLTNMDHHFRYNPKFNINGTITGRMSSPFHSMPNGCDIKRMVVSRWADSGGLVLAADESQLELRLVAALSNETSLIESFKAGVDAHTATACVVFSEVPEKITKKQRQIGKTVNFAVLYGKTTYNLAQDLNITEREAANIMEMFYSRAQRLIAWKREVEEITLGCGYVETMFGRKIQVFSATPTKDSEIEEAKRLAVNYRVQSAASDLMLNATTDIWHEVKHNKLLSILLATVHDSMEYDVYPGEIFEMVRLFKESGETKVQNKYPWLTCPLHLDIEIGTSWGGALKADINFLNSDTLTFTTSGLSSDIKRLVRDAKRAYDVSYEILEEKELGEDSFSMDVFVRDAKEWKAQVSIGRIN